MPSPIFFNKKACIAGFSLLEVLVAAIIFSLLIAGSAGFFIAGKKLILHSRSRMTGGELGKYFLDPLQMQVDQRTWDTACLKTGTCPEQQRGVQEGLDGNYTANYTVTPDYNSTSISKVKVEIKWNEEPY